jgi:hypothetical protein
MSRNHFETARSHFNRLRANDLLLKHCVVSFMLRYVEARAQEIGHEQQPIL